MLIKNKSFSIYLFVILPLAVLSALFVFANNPTVKCKVFGACASEMTVPHVYHCSYGGGYVYNSTIWCVEDTEDKTYKCNNCSYSEPSIVCNWAKGCSTQNNGNKSHSCYYDDTDPGYGDDGGDDPDPTNTPVPTATPIPMCQVRGYKVIMPSLTTNPWIN